MPQEPELERTEVEAALAARRELGPDYDAALVDSFAERIEAAVAARMAQDVEARRAEASARGSAGPRQLTLGIVSAAVGVPVTAISLAVPGGGATSLLAMLVGWAGLVGINVAHALQASRGS